MFDIAYLSPGTVGSEFAISLANTIREYPDTKIYTAIAKKLILQKNQITRFWLGDSDKDWLLWSDSDLSWRAEAIKRLVETADAPGVFTGLWFHYSDKRNIYPGFFPVREGDRLFAVMEGYLEFPSDHPFEVEGTGGTFILIHRKVLETLDDDTEYPFFKASLKDEHKFGYMQFFSIKVKDAGFPIVVEPRAAIYHHEVIPLDRTHYAKHWGRH